MSSAVCRTPDDALAAVRGERIPSPIGPPGTLFRVCLIRGIRFHDGFATELHGNPDRPDITRALNARAIMSNRIPDMNDEAEFPYCFWHPDLPAEDTLRKLLARYPGRPLLSYQVGRTCAAAGYKTLYTELQLLPDVAIAEEARDNRRSGKAIYEHVMGHPVRYACMDDYNRGLRRHFLKGACLNGDTCVRSALDKTQSCRPTRLRDSFLWARPPYTFDITEDWSVAETGTRPQARPVDPEAIALLHAPLPADLPTTDKDLLILMAAWSGDIDRYARLRRPHMISGESSCVARGVHHHPLFAKWWSMQPEAQNPLCQRYVNARFVMSNDLSWLTDAVPDDHLPRMMWFPERASRATYLELARRRPRLKTWVAQACIHANYQTAFDSLDVAPSVKVWRKAYDSSNPHYPKSIVRRAEELGINFTEEDDIRSSSGSSSIPDEDGIGPLLQSEMLHGSPQSMRLYREITLDHVGFEEEGMSEAGTFYIGNVLLHAIAAESARPPPPFEVLDLGEAYLDAPYVDSPDDLAMVGLHPNPSAPRGGYRGRGTRGRGGGRGATVSGQ